MKQVFFAAMLITSITGNLCAQTKQISNADKTFEPAPNSIHHKFLVDLSKGNKMQVEVTSFDNIDYLLNADSILKSFLHDIASLKDSLSNEIMIKRIDFSTDPAGRKRIRIQQIQPKGSSFLIANADVSALKLEQDTIYISGLVPGMTEGTIVSQTKQVNQYFRIGFFINDLSELPVYADGRLNEKMNAIKKSYNEKWVQEKNESWHIFKGDQSISGLHPRGYYMPGNGDFLEINAGVNLQQYKNYFVPGFNVSASLGFNTPKFKNSIGFSWEPGFVFAKNSQGNLETFRNDFVAINFSHIRRNETYQGHEMPNFGLFQRISLGYLIRRNGDFYDPHTLRLGIDAAHWMNGKIRLEPMIYFHDFFKGTTPGVRLNITF
ncbi:MAG: hypothetical protein QM726_13565 [Chitinophagaceae bacterium]